MSKETRPPMTHELKCHPEPFKAVKRWEKNFEFRKDDRDYRVGDTLWLREWDPHYWDLGIDEKAAAYTDDDLHRTVTYIIREGYGIPEGYCIMALAGQKDRLPPDPDPHIEDQEACLEAKRQRFEARTEGESAEQIERVMRGQPFEFDSAGLMEGSVEAFEEYGYNDKNKVEERFRGDLLRVWKVAWIESRARLIGRYANTKAVSVDRIMEVVKEYLSSREVIVMRNAGGPLPGDLVWNDLRTRLTSIFNGAD